MEEFVRQLIRKKCEKSELRTQPSEAFKLYFGRKHGVEFPPPEHYSYTPIEFTNESKTKHDRPRRLAPRHEHCLGDDAPEAGTAGRQVSRINGSVGCT